MVIVVVKDLSDNDDTTFLSCIVKNRHVPYLTAQGTRQPIIITCSNLYLINRAGV